MEIDQIDQMFKQHESRLFRTVVIVAIAFVAGVFVGMGVKA